MWLPCDRATCVKLENFRRLGVHHFTLEFNSHPHNFDLGEMRALNTKNSRYVPLRRVGANGEVLKVRALCALGTCVVCVCVHIV